MGSNRSLISSVQLEFNCGLDAIRSASKNEQLHCRKSAKKIRLSPARVEFCQLNHNRDRHFLMRRIS
jgi:hypothetical protein